MIGAPVPSSPITPSLHASIDSWSLRSKIPLGNWRRNFERSVTAVSECVGGTPSGTAVRGSLNHPSRVIQRTGAIRAPRVSHSVCGDGPRVGTRRYSA